MQRAISTDRHPRRYNLLPGLVPGIHVFAVTDFTAGEDVGGRVKPGHGIFIVVAPDMS